MKNKTVIINEIVLFLVSICAFCSSFFFAISDNCDFLYKLHPNIVFFLRLCSVLIFAVLIVSLLVIVILKKFDIYEKKVLSVILLLIPVIISSVITVTTYNDYQYYNEDGVVDSVHNEFFPYKFNDSVCSFSE